MEQQGKPISELLNSVAIIQQELQNCQDPAKEIELLGELKLLAARIYIETDFAMLTMGEFAEENVEIDLEGEEELGDDFQGNSLEIQNQEREEVAPILAKDELIHEQGWIEDEKSPEIELAIEENAAVVSPEIVENVPDLFSMGSFMPEVTTDFVPEGNIETSMEVEESNLETTEMDLEPVIVADLPFAEDPVAESPVMEAHLEQVPELEVPVVEAPVFETPEVEIPVMELPILEVPAVESPTPVVPMETPMPSVPVETTMSVEPQNIVSDSTPVNPESVHSEPVAVNPVNPGEMPPPALPGMNVEAIINQMPISRRFEFANMLFAGDVQRMGTFIHELLQSPSGSARMDVYERWYEENNWRRRDEAASDLLRLIKRIFPS